MFFWGAEALLAIPLQTFAALNKIARGVFFVTASERDGSPARVTPTAAGAAGHLTMPATAEVHPPLFFPFSG